MYLHKHTINSVKYSYTNRDYECRAKYSVLENIRMFLTTVIRFPEH